jgi:hypothetical protein
MVVMERAINKKYTYIRICIHTYTHTCIHTHIHTYIHTIDTPICPCRKEEQTVDHIIYVCELLQKERDKLILGVAKTNNWPISKRRLLSEHSQVFHKFIHELPLEKLNEVG